MRKHYYYYYYYTLGIRIPRIWKKNINRKLIEVATTPTTTIIANEGVEEQHAIESLHQDGQTLK